MSIKEKINSFIKNKWPNSWTNNASKNNNKYSIYPIYKEIIIKP